MNFSFLNLGGKIREDEFKLCCQFKITIRAALKKVSSDRYLSLVDRYPGFVFGPRVEVR